MDDSVGHWRHFLQREFYIASGFSVCRYLKRMVERVPQIASVGNNSYSQESSRESAPDMYLMTQSSFSRDRQDKSFSYIPHSNGGMNCFSSLKKRHCLNTHTQLKSLCS